MARASAPFGFKALTDGGTFGTVALAVFHDMPILGHVTSRSALCMVQAYDYLEMPCPQADLDVPFRYCRTIAKGLPCPRVLECWEDRFTIRDYLRDHYTPEELIMIFGETRHGLSGPPEINR
jgi:hypothetical protein